MAASGRIKEEIAGVLSVLAGGYLAVAVFSYDKWDPSLLTFVDKAPGNYAGAFGATLADLTVTTMGISAYLIPLFLIALGLRCVMGYSHRNARLAGAIFFIVSVSVLGALVGGSFGLEGDPGGLMGRLISHVMVKWLTIMGAYIATLALVLSSAILVSPSSLVQFILRNTLGGGETPQGDETSAPAMMPDEAEASDEDDAGQPDDESGDMPQEYVMAEDEPEEEPEQDDVPVDDRYSDEEPAYAAGPVMDEPYEDEPPPYVEPLAAADPVEVIVVDEKARRESDEPYDEGTYRLPPIEMLKLYDQPGRLTEREIQASSTLLEQKLDDFKVQGRVADVHAGPVVTMYEFEPAPGVKINKVVSLSDDLALALKARSIRISAVPGKAAIGIEIPNPKRETVPLREIIASESFRRSDSELTLALGKDIFGTTVVADLTRMPHLLVAGATGSGKSVFMNAMVMSILYRARPDEVKMLMIDPKLLELNSYDGIPHLISPVVTNPKDASEMLKRMVFEMERRYRLIADRGVRNIASFNASVPPEDRIPYIVIFIDELADLMLSSAAQVEDSIARLAQMARASGIHLVIATQRPSVDVITGVIKANFPARVAFQVTTKVDSRTIIDAQGAEQLIGRGDMLFMLPGARLLRVHGALVTESEVRDAVDFIKAQAGPDYSILQELVEAEETARADAEQATEKDELFDKAVELGQQTGEVSISSIQRRLKIGYNRAARIMEIMEEEGLVGPPKAAGKPRDFIGR